MSISLQLNEEQSQRIEELARKLSISSTELAIAAINDLVSRPADDFERAVRYVLDKNRELYQRLA